MKITSANDIKSPKKLICFDLDGTLSQHKSHMPQANKDVLFVGDDFGDGGGDSHVRIKGMDYIHIEDYTTLPEKLAFL